MAAVARINMGTRHRRRTTANTTQMKAQMKAQTTIMMIRAFAVYAVCILLLAGCKKEEQGMTAKECQDRYDSIIDEWHAAIADAQSRLDAGTITVDEFFERYNEAVSTANHQAHSLVDCDGWQTIPRVY